MEKEERKLHEEYERRKAIHDAQIHDKIIERADEEGGEHMKEALAVVTIDILLRILSLVLFSAVMMHGLSLLNIGVTYFEAVVVMVLLKVISLWIVQDFRVDIENEHRSE